MATINCPGCRKPFDNNNPESIVTRATAALSGAIALGIWGSRFGIVGGPLGGINGCFVGATAGAITGAFAADQFRRCPGCGKVFKT